VKGAASRLRKYLAERARTPGLDFEIVNGLNVGHPDRDAMLLSSDIQTVLDALGDLAPDIPGPPYAEGDDVSFLTGHNWHVGKVMAVVETTPGSWEVTAVLDGKSVTCTVDARGVGGGIAPLRQR
jgi:hypothetical protein